MIRIIASNSSKLLLIFIFCLLSNIDLLCQHQKLNISTEMFAESSPYVSFNGEKLVYSTNQTGSWRIYISTNIDGRWSEPLPVLFEGEAISPDAQIQDPALNATGDILYFSAKLTDSNGGLDIYFSNFENNQWSKPQNFKEVNSISDDVSPSVSAKYDYIFFARKYPAEKEGEYIHKILYSKRNNSGKYTEPSVLPEKINASDENYPFLSEDNRILYFSSKRDKEPKGYNLFFSRMEAENVWTDPKPIYSLNTDFDDICPSKIANTKELFYAQYLDKKKNDLGDIVVAPISIKTAIPKKVFEFNGTVYDQATKKPIESEIIVRYSKNMEVIAEQVTKLPDCSYFFYIPPGKDVEFEIFAKNYSHAFFEYKNDYNSKVLDEPITTDIELFNNSTLLLNVFDEEIFEPLQGNITITDSDSNEISIDNLQYKNNGRYDVKLDIGKLYNFDIVVRNYEPYKFTFDLTDVVQYSEFEKDIELVPSKTAFEINIADIETDEAMEEVEIVITNLEKNETIVKKVRKDENGKFIVDLRDGDKYEINVNGPKGYAFYNTKVDMDKTESKKLDVKLQPLKAKTKLVLNDITFETNSAEINASSFEEIDRVVKLLIDNPDINIEISAHTDDVGSHAYNEKLSHKRAQSVVNYLVSNDLSVNRLIAKGYGETTPVVPNNSEENKAKNRRVELKIVDVNENSTNE